MLVFRLAINRYGQPSGDTKERQHVDVRGNEGVRNAGRSIKILGQSK